MFFLPAFLLAGMAAVFVVWLGTFIWQIFLSKADNPWLGLILPGITFGLILYISTMAPDSYTVWYVLSRGEYSHRHLFADLFLCSLEKEKKVRPVLPMRTSVTQDGRWAFNIASPGGSR